MMVDPASANSSLIMFSEAMREYYWDLYHVHLQMWRISLIARPEVGQLLDT